MDRDRTEHTLFCSRQRKALSRARRTLRCGLVGTVVLAVGSFGASVWCASAAEAASGGASSPAGAVIGALNAKSKEQTCAYVQPSVQAQCLGRPWTTFTVSVKVEKVVTDGDRALVAVLGDVCVFGYYCLTNQTPDAGMPTGSLTFAKAWEDTIHHSSGFGPFPCVKMDGKWYLHNI